MSDQLTAFERALLKQFEGLAAGSEASLKASAITSEQLQDMSKMLISKITKLERRIGELEQREKRLIDALIEQSNLTEQWRAESKKLLQRANTLLTEHRK